jgi:hypothetical protein
MLVSQHMAYAIANPNEIRQFETLSDHMVYYFVSVIGMSAHSARAYVDDFFSQTTFSAVGEGV